MASERLGQETGRDRLGVSATCDSCPSQHTAGARPWIVTDTSASICPNTFSNHYSLTETAASW